MKLFSNEHVMGQETKYGLAPIALDSSKSEVCSKKLTLNAGVETDGNKSRMKIKTDQYNIATYCNCIKFKTELSSQGTL